MTQIKLEYSGAGVFFFHSNGVLENSRRIYYYFFNLFNIVQ